MRKSSEDFSSKKAELTKPQAEKKMSPERAHSVEFVSSKYDDLVAFKDEAAKQIKQLFTRVAEISILCDRIAKSIDALEACSYQFNVRIEGMPAATENETSDQTGDQRTSRRQLGFPDHFDISHINVYNHLTPRLRELPFESKKYKNANNFKFCRAKNGAVCLRKTEITVTKLTGLDELNELRESR